MCTVLSHDLSRVWGSGGTPAAKSKTCVAQGLIQTEEKSSRGLLKDGSPLQLTQVQTHDVYMDFTQY